MRSVDIETHLLPFVEIILVGRKKTERLLPPMGCIQNEANLLRADLLRAGVDRPALHVDTRDKKRRPLRFHDLRSTGLTHMAARIR